MDEDRFSVTTVIRFISHIPFFYLAITCYSHLTKVLNKPELLHPPYSPNILAGQGLAVVATCIGAVWNMIAFVPLYLMCEGSQVLLLLPCIMDSALAAAILTDIKLQSTYLPQPLGQCGNVLDWHPKDAPSMYLVLVLPDPDEWPTSPIHETAKGMCNAFVTAWIVQIVIAVLLCIACVFDIKYLCRTRYGGSNDVWSPWTSRRQRHKNFFWHFLAPHMRYRTRYTQKKRDHLQSCAATTTGRSDNDELESSDQDHSHRSSLLVNALPIYGTMMSVCFGEHNSEDCVHASGGQVRDCWSCSTGICDSCKVETRHGKTRTEVHLNRCEALCSDCYYKGHCEDDLCGSFRFPRHCDCETRTRGTASEETHEVCQGCRRHGVNLCVVMREQREQAEMKQIIAAGLQCSNPNCGKSLSKSGPLWWRCPECYRECRSPYHVHWWLTAEARATRS